MMHFNTIWSHRPTSMSDLCLGDLILLSIMSPDPIKGNKNDCRGFWWGVGLLLVGEGIKESLCWKEFLSPKALIFCFFLCQLRLRHKGFFGGFFLPCPPSWKKLHWPLLSIASICEQLSLLQMEMRPKIVTNGAMPLNTDVLRSAPRVHMPDQINSNPSTDRTDISFTNPLLQQFVWSQGPRNNCTSTRGKSEVMLSLGARRRVQPAQFWPPG